MQEFSQNMLSQTHSMEQKVDGLVHETKVWYFIFYKEHGFVLSWLGRCGQVVTLPHSVKECLSIQGERWLSMHAIAVWRW